MMTTPLRLAVTAKWVSRAVLCSLVCALLCLAVPLASCEQSGPDGVPCACSDPACPMEGCDPTCESGCAGGRCDMPTGLCTICGNGQCEVGEKPSTCSEDCPAVNRLDLLFVIDNSRSMAEGQVSLSQEFSRLLTVLYADATRIPDLHLGVTSTNLGSGSFDLELCGDQGGDGGALLVGETCVGPTGTNYLVEVAPRGCTLDRATDGTCFAHDCTDTHCAHEPSSALREDPVTGCPRCRNYPGSLVEDAFRCVATLGTEGCSFEQSLEAMRLALDDHPANTGFLRPNSVLAVVIFTDEDDCSTHDPEFFDDSQTTLDSVLGPLSYRCFEWGTTCDVNLRTHLGDRHGCLPRDDPAALLYPVSRYVDFLRGLRDPGRVVVTAITGPVAPSEDAPGFDVTIEEAVLDNPAPAYTCQTANTGAIPAIRVRTMVSEFHQETDSPGMFGSICHFAADGTLPLVGTRIRDALW